MIYTVEQIMQAISTLGPTEKKRLYRELSVNPGAESGFAESRQSDPAANAQQLDGEPDYLLVFDGGSKGNPGLGYGSYAIARLRRGESAARYTRPEHFRIARVELGDGMTSNEAEYDTLLVALESLLQELAQRGEDPATVHLEVRGDSRLILQQIQGLWKAKEERLRERRDRALALLRRFGGFSLTETPRSQIVTILGH